MKKFALLVVGIMASGMASAETFDASGLLTQDVCSNLNENVSINLTAGVVAGVDCKTARVAIAACHSAGMLKSRQMGRKTIQVASSDPNAAPGTTVDQEVSCTVGTADPTCALKPVSGAAVATATTLRGTVNPEYPGTGACTVQVAENVAADLN